MKKINALCVVAGLLASMSVMAENLRYGVESQYPPFESRNAQGELEGFDIELGNAICKVGNFTCSWVESSFDALIPALSAKKFDAINSAMNITEARAKSIGFTKPIYRIPSMLIGKTGAVKEATAEGLQGKNIGVLQGSIQETYAKQHWEPKGVTVTSYQDQNQVYNDMVAGRLDGTLVMSAAGQSGFLDKPQGKGFGFIGQAVDDDKILGSGIGYGLRKDDTKLKAALDEAIVKVQNDGTITKLAAKYFPGIDVSVK
ncbi:MULTISPECIES: transporter substrate-binding domain-containing protein [unclassified Erwinia]|uniref:transporter substrate-binding domain-containing protein n=1 Tax=unclassified Erwinia TaxID=2622719 RepID=UPI0006F511F8|nr:MULTISPECIES: transporter substrate-binding domain-containing protein [unclassified Erwinia]KQN55714.1 ABC transporter substrate-binding protein [Erwinia sp. Leaf53]PLV56443.1 ABC transporter substrate-binding protein [Erwinia sp. B116]